MRFAIAMILSLACAARAYGDEEEARRHFETAAAAYASGGRANALGDFELARQAFKHAVEEYRASYELAPHAATLFALAQAYRALGDHEHALLEYREYLKQAPNGKYSADARKLIPELEQQIQQAHATQTNPPHDVPSSPDAEHLAAPNPAATIIQPPHAAPTVAPAVVVTAPRGTENGDRARSVPVYKKWWLWATVGAVVAVGLGVGLGLGLSQSNYPGYATKPSDGVYHF